MQPKMTISPVSRTPAADTSVASSHDVLRAENSTEREATPRGESKTTKEPGDIYNELSPPVLEPKTTPRKKFHNAPRQLQHEIEQQSQTAKLAEIIREEIVRQHRDNDRAKCPAGVNFYEDRVGPLLIAEKVMECLNAE